MGSRWDAPGVGEMWRDSSLRPNESAYVAVHKIRGLGGVQEHGCRWARAGGAKSYRPRRAVDRIGLKHIFSTVFVGGWRLAIMGLGSLRLGPRWFRVGNAPDHRGEDYDRDKRKKQTATTPTSPWYIHTDKLGCWVVIFCRGCCERFSTRAHVFAQPLSAMRTLGGVLIDDTLAVLAVELRGVRRLE